MSKFDWLSEELRELEKASLLRKPLFIDSPQGPVVKIQGSEKVLFCSNNYLNLANHPRVARAAIEAIRESGYGSGASRLISGSMRWHSRLEAKITEMFGKQAAIIFSSGFIANEALIRTIPKKNDLLLLDKLDHASIIDAAISSEADFRTFRRREYRKIERLLADAKFDRKFIITESIFSMDGDFAELKKLVELKKKYNAFLIVDEAHAFGCMGENGAGLAEELGLIGDVDIFVGTLSKAVGASGGFVAGDKCLCDYLINKARAFIYTTASAPSNCAAAAEAIEVIKNEPARREKLRNNAEYLRSRLEQMGLDIGKSQSHVVPVIIGDNQKTLDISASLFEAGYMAVAIRPPTVAAGTARLRISVQSEHTKEQIDGLCNALGKILSR